MLFMIKVTLFICNFKYYRDKHVKKEKTLKRALSTFQLFVRGFNVKIPL